MRGFAVGDRVLASAGIGGFAEESVVPARAAYPLPESMSFEEGAALPIIYPTSYAGLVDRGGLRAGETLLVHAAAGGVGLAAVQIGRALGARVIGTAGGAEKCEIALREGAEVCIDYRAGGFRGARAGADRRPRRRRDLRLGRRRDHRPEPQVHRLERTARDHRLRVAARSPRSRPTASC